MVPHCVLKASCPTPAFQHCRSGFESLLFRAAPQDMSWSQYMPAEEPRPDYGAGDW